MQMLNRLEFSFGQHGCDATRKGNGFETSTMIGENDE